MATLPDQAPAGLEAPEPKEPPYRPLDLFVDPAGGAGDLQYFGSAIVTSMDDALDAKVAGLKIALRVPAKRQDPVERCVKLAPGLDNHGAISQIVFAVGLRIGCGVDPQTLEIGTEGVRLDVRRGRVLNRTLLGQDVPERGAGFPKLRR